MRVAVHAPTLPILEDFTFFVVNEAPFAIEVQPFEHPQDFCSTLFRDKEMIGVALFASAEQAALSVHEMRQADVKNVVFALHIAGKKDLLHSATARALILAAGADDAQQLGIDRREFHARLDALSRRDSGLVLPVTPLPNGCAYDFAARDFTTPSGRVHLTDKESTMLEVLLRRPGIAISKEMFLDQLYGGRDEPNIKIIDVFICKLRKKIVPALNCEIIKTVWGRGFMFEPEGFIPDTVPMNVVAYRGPRRTAVAA